MPYLSFVRKVGEESLGQPGTEARGDMPEIAVIAA